MQAKITFATLTAIIAVAGGMMPLVLYFLLYGQTAAITPPQARALLLAGKEPVVLVDVRTAAEYDAAHIDGACHWPLMAILAVSSPEQVPEQFRGRKLLLLCEAGVNSAIAASHLAKTGIGPVVNVRGGLQEWIGSVAGPEGGDYGRFRTMAGEVRPFPTRQSPLHEKLAIVISGFGVKATYTLLALVIAIVLRRSDAADLVALRWSMIFFFVGENCCAINYFVFTEKSYLFEYLHSYGMLLAFGFATYAILEGIDSRIVQVTAPDKKCAALGLCRKCVKYDSVPCGFRRTFFMIIPAAMVLAVMPLCADWQTNSYNTMIFGTFYNYTHRILYQQFERVYCPAAAILLLAVSAAVLAGKQQNSMARAKLFFAAGIGPLGFGMFRSILTGMYSRNLVWFNFWEEISELIFIVGIVFVLWLFRGALLKSEIIAAGRAGN